MGCWWRIDTASQTGDSIAEPGMRVGGRHDGKYEEDRRKRGTEGQMDVRVPSERAKSDKFKKSGVDVDST